MLSENSKNSVWVAKEVERAINYRKPIIPVQLEDLTLEDEFELYISTDQVVVVKTIDENNAEMQKILKSVLAYAGQNDIVANHKSQKQIPHLKESNAEKERVFTNNYYFKISLSSTRGRLYFYSEESLSTEKTVSVNITNDIWNDFVICGKEMLSKAFSYTPVENILITPKKNLGIIECAPDDGHNYYDERFRLDFNVSIVYKQMPEKYDSVHIDIGKNFLDISLFYLGKYAFKNTSDDTKLEDFGISKDEMLSAANQMICFAKRNNSLIISDSFRRKVYSDGSGGYILDFIEKPKQITQFETQLSDIRNDTIHSKQKNKCYIALGDIGCRILNCYEKESDSDKTLFLYYDTDIATKESLNIKNDQFFIFKNFSRGLGGLRENGKKLLELSNYMDCSTALYSVYKEHTYNKSGVELVFIKSAFGGFGLGVVLNFQKTIKEKIKENFCDELKINTKIIAFTTECFSFLGDAKATRLFESNTVEFMKYFCQKRVEYPNDLLLTNLYLISKPNLSTFSSNLANNQNEIWISDSITDISNKALVMC